MFDPDQNPVPELESDLEPEPECITVLGPISLRLEVAVPAVPVQVPAPVPQHWLKLGLTT
jgi:hypothetical protein